MPLAGVTRLAMRGNTTAPDSFVTLGEDPLAGWRNRLKPEQARRILGIAKSFRPDFYIEELALSHDHLYSLAAA